MPPDPAPGEHPAQAGPWRDRHAAAVLMPVRAERVLRRPVQQVHQVPEQRKPLAVGGARNPEQPGQRLRRAGRDQLGYLVDVIHWAR